MLKVDHRKMLKHLYSASKTAPAILEIPPMSFLMIDGKGRPPEKDFQEAVSTLYPVAYTLKFMVRASDDVDYHVMPLEVIWKVNRQTKDFAWTMLVMQPEYVTGDLYGEAVAKAQAKNDPPLLSRLRFERFTEGTCVQFLHTGRYQDMEAAFEKMLAFAQQNGYAVPARNTHDIYLNDSRKTKPENLKTIMRLVVEKS
jgi:hypothetical protein